MVIAWTWRAVFAVGAGDENECTNEFLMQAVKYTRISNSNWVYWLRNVVVGANVYV